MQDEEKPISEFTSENKLLIPYEPNFEGLEKANQRFHMINFKKLRAIFVDKLRYATSIVETAKNLKQDEVYKIVLKPDGAIMYDDKFGNLKAVWYKDGVIVQQTRLQRVGLNLFKAATAIGNQFLLISIAIQLNRIENLVNRVLEELHSDRIAQINSGIEMFEQAMFVDNHDNQKALIFNGIQSLTEGIEQTMRSLKNQISQIPDDGFWDSWGWGWSEKSQEAEKKMELALESFESLLSGIKTLSECYAALDETNVGEMILFRKIKGVKDAGVANAAKKARLIKIKADILPELPWNSFLEAEARILNSLQVFNNSEKMPEIIEIEVKPRELLEHKNGKM
jgi:hypothetical protein